MACRGTGERDRKKRDQANLIYSVTVNLRIKNKAIFEDSRLNTMLLVSLKVRFQKLHCHVFSHLIPPACWPAPRAARKSARMTDDLTEKLMQRKGIQDGADGVSKAPWNQGKIIGQKAPLKLKDIWAIRMRLQLGLQTRELALFDLVLDGKLRASDLLRVRVRDICHGDRIPTRAIVTQQKIAQPLQFEITLPTRDAVTEWIEEAALANDD